MSYVYIKILGNTILWGAIGAAIHLYHKNKREKIAKIGQLKDDIIVMKKRSYHEQAMQRARDRLNKEYHA